MSQDLEARAKAHQEGPAFEVGYVVGAKEERKLGAERERVLVEALSKVEKAAGHGSVGACRMWATEALAKYEFLKGKDDKRK